MSDEEFQALKARILRAHPIRQWFAKQLKVKLDDQTLAEMYLELSLSHTELADEALTMIRTLNEGRPDANA